MGEDSGFLKKNEVMDFSAFFALPPAAGLPRFILADEGEDLVHDLRSVFSDEIWESAVHLK